MKIKRIVIMEIKKFENFFESVSSKKSTFKFCIDGTIICSFLVGVSHSTRLCIHIG